MNRILQAYVGEVKHLLQVKVMGLVTTSKIKFKLVIIIFIPLLLCRVWYPELDVGTAPSRAGRLGFEKALLTHPCSAVPVLILSPGF